MENGKGFEQYLEENSLGWSQKCKIMEGIVNGLKNIHEKNLCLRYFNPQKILIDEFNNAKVCIFTNFGQESNVVYLAPEILLDKGIEGDARASDIYSIGMILYKIIFEKEPFFNIRNKSQLGKKIINGDRPPFIRDIPPLLKELITKCWNGIPSNRPIINELVDFFLNPKRYEFIVGNISDEIKQMVKQVSPEQSSNILEQATSRTLNYCMNFFF